MLWSLSAHARRLLTLAPAGLVLAIVTGRPEFAGVAAPALLLLAGWRPGGQPGSWSTARVTAQQLVEGEQAAIVVQVSGHGDLAVQATIAAAEAFEAGPAPSGGRATARRCGSRSGRGRGASGGSAAWRSCCGTGSG